MQDQMQQKTMSRPENLFDNGKCQTQQRESAFKIYHQVNLKELIRNFLEQNSDEKLKEDDWALGPGGKEINGDGELPGEGGTFGSFWGSVQVQPGLLFDYRVRLLSVKQEADNISEKSPLNYNIQMGGKMNLVEDLVEEASPISINDLDHKQEIDIELSEAEKVVFPMEVEVITALRMHEHVSRIKAELSENNRRTDIHWDITKAVKSVVTVHSSITRKQITKKREQELDLFKRKSSRFEFKYNIYKEELEHAVFTFNLSLELFLHLELSKRPTSLSKLVEAFGWTRETAYVQQDIQEFCCLLMDNLEKKFADKKDFVNPFAKSTVKAEDPQKNLIKSLFNGKTEQVISCRDVKFESTRQENFIDIQLSLKSFTTKFYSIHDSLLDFLAKEELTDDNKYATEKWGKQDADRRVRFLELPKVLMFHLRRCEFDFQTETNQKIKHRFEFPQVLEMNRFREPELQIEGGNPYKLYCIFVHHGLDGIAGHYTVLLQEENQWYEFDDEQAQKVNWEFVKRNSYGGENREMTLENKQLRLITKNKKTLSHAYMMIYIDQRYEKELLGSPNSANLKQAARSLQSSILKKTVSVNSSFVKRAVIDKSFQELSSEIKESNKSFYLKQLVPITVYSIWHFLGEPTSKGPLFSEEYKNCNFIEKKLQFFKKMFGTQSLVQLVNKAESLKKSLISDSVPRPEVESDLKALHDPVNGQIQVEEVFSPKKLITDWLEQTPDYLNFHPQNVKNVLINKMHLLSEDIIDELHHSQCMINLETLLDSKNKPKGDTFFETIVSPALSGLTLKMHLLSIILSKNNRTAFGLAHLDADPQKEAYLNFSHLDESSVSKLLGIFDVYLYYADPSPTFSLLHLDSSSTFIDSIFESSAVSLVLLPANLDNVPLSSLLSQQEARPVISKDCFPNWALKVNRFGLKRFNMDQMFTTDTLLPFPSAQKPFYKKSSSLVAKNSNQLDQSHIFQTFKDIHSCKKLGDFPVSVNLQNLSALSTTPLTQSVLLKLYIPHLKILVNHSFHRLDSHTPFDQIWQIFARSAQIKDFYLFHECGYDAKNKDQRVLVYDIELLQPPCRIAPFNYWKIMRTILQQKLFVKVKVKAQDGQDQFILKDILGTEAFNLKCFILVPAIQASFPQLLPPLGDSQLPKSCLIEEENVTPPKTANRSVLAPIEVMSTGKKTYPSQNINEDSVSKESVKTQKIPSKPESGVENAPEESKSEFRMNTSLMFLDLSVVLGFLDLYRRFENLLYSNISKTDTKLHRKLAICDDMSDKHLFKYLYRRYLNEKHYLTSILNYNQSHSLAEGLYPNGNLFYGNTNFDKYFGSISSEVGDGIDITNPDYENIKLSSYLHYRKRWIDTDSFDQVQFSPEDLVLQKLAKAVPYPRSCFVEDPNFGKVLSECLFNTATPRNPKSIQTENKEPPSAVQDLVLTLKKRFLKKWTDVPYKQRNISRHLEFADCSITLTIPVNAQKVKILYLNLFANGLKYEIVNIPNNSFQTKQDLLHVILNKNSELLEQVISDEKSFSLEGEPKKLTWVGEVSTINIIQNRLGDTSNLVKDLFTPAACEVLQSDIANSLQRFSLNNVFEIHRLDLFHGNIFHHSLHPLDEVVREHLPEIQMVKILTLTTPFLNGLLSLYNKHRDNTSQLPISKYLKLLRRCRAENLKFGHFHFTSSGSEVLDLTKEAPNQTTTTFYDRFFQFRLVILFFLSFETQQTLQIPRMFWIPSDLSFMELDPLMMFFFNQMKLLRKTKMEGVVQKKIYGQDGEYDFQDCASSFLCDNFDEDNIIKVIYFLK